MTTSLRLVVVVYPERHLQRMLEVNFARLDFEVASYASLDEIPLTQPEPALLVFDSDHFTDSEVMNFRRSREWDRVMVKSTGRRRSDYGRQRTLEASERTRWLTIIAIACVLAALSFLARR